MEGWLEITRIAIAQNKDVYEHFKKRTKGTRSTCVHEQERGSDSMRKGDGLQTRYTNGRRGNM